MVQNAPSYIDLIESFPPRTIKSETDLEKTQLVIDALIDKGELTEDEKDYLNLLGMLIYDYEQKQDIIPDIWGVDALNALMSEMNLKQKDLVGIFKTESIVSEILERKRELTLEHIEKLADFFKISSSVFLRKNPLSKSI